MKRIVVIMLVLVMLLAMMTGCGSKTESKQTDITESSETSNNEGSEDSNSDTNNNDSESNDEGNDDSDESMDNEVVAGTELSSFMSNYLDAKTKPWDTMSSKFEEEDNTAFIFGGLAFAFVDLSVVEISFFDALTVGQGDTFKGKLMFSDIEAWKKVKGDIIEFGYDYTFPEDKNQSQKGDRQFSQGKLNNKTGELVYQHYTERGGKMINKYVVEIIRNSDISYSSQMYIIDTNNGDSDSPPTLNSYFTWFEGEDIISLLAEEESGYDFQYDSILGKKNIKPEEMANGKNIIMKTSFVDGVASFEEGE